MPAPRAGRLGPFLASSLTPLLERKGRGRSFPTTRPSYYPIRALLPTPLASSPRPVRAEAAPPTLDLLGGAVEQPTRVAANEDPAELLPARLHRPRKVADRLLRVADAGPGLAAVEGAEDPISQARHAPVEVQRRHAAAGG